MTRDEIEALVARERPGWRVVDLIEDNDESGLSFEVTIESGNHRAVLLSARTRPSSASGTEGQRSAVRLRAVLGARPLRPRARGAVSFDMRAAAGPDWDRRDGRCWARPGARRALGASSRR